jgi:hypothetical protein
MDKWQEHERGQDYLRGGVPTRNNRRAWWSPIEVDVAVGKPPALGHEKALEITMLGYDETK